MNKARIIGLVMLVAGIITHFSIQSAAPDFIKGALVGAGFILLLTGKKSKADSGIS